MQNIKMEIDKLARKHNVSLVANAECKVACFQPILTKEERCFHILHV